MLFLTHTPSTQVFQPKPHPSIPHPRIHIRRLNMVSYNDASFTYKRAELTRERLNWNIYREEARFLTHRIPPSLLADEEVLAKVQKLLQAVWSKDYPLVAQLLGPEEGGWPGWLERMVGGYRGMLTLLFIDSLLFGVWGSLLWRYQSIMSSISEKSVVEYLESFFLNLRWESWT